MPEPQLSVRSARARELAHSLAKRERRTVAEIVERALEEYAAMVYGEIMGDAQRAGTALSVPDGMIASIAVGNEGRLATRNTRDSTNVPVDLVNPWEA